MPDKEENITVNVGMTRAQYERYEKVRALYGGDVAAMEALLCGYDEQRNPRTTGGSY